MDGTLQSPDNDDGVEDFPDGGFTVNFTCDMQMTDRLCAVCNGTRKRITHLFRYAIRHITIQGESMTAEEFCKRHPVFGPFFLAEMALDVYRDPTCEACREDMYVDTRITLERLQHEDDDEDASKQ